MTALRVQIPEKLGDIFSGEADYRGAYGGRGAAKTIGFARMAILEMMSLADGKPWKFLCGRELQKSLKDSVHSVIASQISQMGLDEYFEVGREFIRHKNGNEFLFYGLRTNIAEIKSLYGVRRTWLEEAQKVSKQSLEYLIPTVMRDFPDCEIWASWNPEDEDDPIQKMFTKQADGRTKCVKINWYDNPWFPEGLNKVRLRDQMHNPDKYGWIWEGNFNVNNEASVYGKWMERARASGRVRKGIYDPSLPVFTAWDLGYSDDTAIWWFQVAGNEVRLIDYYANHRQDPRHYVEQIYGRKIVDIKYGENGKITGYSLGEVFCDRRLGYKYDKHYVPHDAANKLLQAGGRSMVDQLFELGVKAFVVASTSQQNQIAAARSTIELSWFDEETCEEGIRCLRKHSFHERDNGTYSTTPNHDDGFSHGCFVGSSEVLTRLGVCAINKLPKTGEVLTKCGWRPYTNPHVTRKNAPLVMVQFEDGYSVKCTPDHLFLTESGWKSAESLAPNTVIQSTLMKLPNILTAAFIGCGQVKGILQEMARGFIEKFGKLPLATYQKIATFTIGTATCLTTSLRIWSVCNPTNICALLGKKQAGKNLLSDLQKTQGRRPQSGTDQTRVAYGISITRILRDCLIGLRRRAKSAAARIGELIAQKDERIKSSAQTNVKCLLIKSVTRLEERQDVWCLTVPDAGHFSLSNGAIVKNCDAYEVIAQIWKSAKIDAPPARPRFLNEMTVNELFYEGLPSKGGITKI